MTSIRLVIAFVSFALPGIAVLTQNAAAQSSPSDYTSAARYDAMGRVTGTIAPDADSSGPLKYAASRTTYDQAGRPIKVETGELSSWKAETIAPANWGGAFTVLSSSEFTYDVMSRKLTDRIKGSDGITVGLTQYSYDSRGRLECTAVRMNPAAYGSLPASACNLGTEGTNGPDRISQTIYDAAGQVVQIRKAVGTSIEVADVTYSYTNNGQIENVIDANGNRAELRYDGFDRQTRWIFPAKAGAGSFDNSTPALAASTSGALNEADYEAYTYDASGNRTSLKKRDGSTLTYQYDALNRMTRKTVPGRSGLASRHERDVYYSYDLRGLQTSARFDSLSGEGLINSYDGFGRLSSVFETLDSQNRTTSYEYDANSNRTKITYPDSAYFTYEYDGLNRVSALKDQTGTTLLTPAYNDRGLPSGLARLGTAQDGSFTYDPVGRLSTLSITNGSSAADVSWGFTRNPASQILAETLSNDSYAWDGHVNVNRSYTTNGLNQYETAGSANFCYDDNGSLIADGTSVYLYDVENRLVEKRAQTNTNCAALSYAGAIDTELRYDPLGRLYYLRDYTGGNGITRFAYDGNAMIAEYASNGTTMLRRYVHGSNAEADDPLIWYEGTSVASSNARHLYADPRGSIVLVAGNTGNTVAINTYDEYGIPGSANAGRFQYTGQAWLPEIGMYYYKARIYSPTLGRFLQTDPIGYDDGMNMYAYVGNDPINGVDPTGMECDGNNTDRDCGENEIVVTGKKPDSDITVGDVGSFLGRAALELAPGGAAVDCIFVSQCDTTDKVLAVVDLVPGLGKLGKLGKLRKLRKFGRACGCVVAGTLISTPTGLVAIETLEIGDIVLAYDVATDEVAEQPVLDVIETEPKPTYDVLLRAVGGETARFEATDDHPWLNVAKEWRNTEELVVGDWLIADDGERFEVVKAGLTGDVEVAYTLTVDTLHTYIMGETGLVVHNAKCPQIQDVKKASSNQRADEIARRHGYRDAHDAKAGRGDSRVNIYTDKDGNGYLSDGKSPPEPL